MAGETQAIGGFLRKRITVDPDEQLVKGVRCATNDSFFRGWQGQLYLTTKRLVWLPDLRQEPQVWHPGEIHDVARGGSQFLSSMTIQAGGHRFEFARLPFFPADDWVKAIDEWVNLS